MLRTLLSWGWSGDLLKLKKAAQNKKNLIGRVAFKLFCLKHQCYIGKNCSIADDVWFPHLTGIHIAADTIVGKGCTIYQHVTLGANRLQGTKHLGAPRIGNNVLIGANACIIGGVTIGDNVRIGAGCIVAEDIPDNAVVVMNKPRIIMKSAED